MRSVEQIKSSDGVRIFKALDRETVLSEIRVWVKRHKPKHPEIIAAGLFGSYARGDYAPGSDIDLLIIVSDSKEPRWFMRSSSFEIETLPLGADVFVYTQAERDQMEKTHPWFQHVLSETIWL